jgi:hypothetical protein
VRRRIRFLDPGLPTRARLEAHDLGGVPVLRADLTGELALAHPARQSREDVAPTVSSAVQELGVDIQHLLGRRRVVPRGGPALTEITAPYEYPWSGHHASAAARTTPGLGHHQRAASNRCSTDVRASMGGGRHEPGAARRVAGRPRRPLRRARTGRTGAAVAGPHRRSSGR